MKDKMNKMKMVVMDCLKKTNTDMDCLKDGSIIVCLRDGDSNIVCLKKTNTDRVYLKKGDRIVHLKEGD